MLDAVIQKRRALFTVDVALQLRDGEACGLFGASGAGKSTVLACIAGAELQESGRVALDGATLFPPPLPLHERGIGYLTQDANLFPHLRVHENVTFGVRNGERATREPWIAQLRERLQLESIWNAPAHAISGGQARRVALARMLARKPKLVLLDEPFAGLDRHLVREMLTAIARWHRELGFMLLAVDHRMQLLERICPRALVIEEGKIVQDAPWDVLRSSPATPLTAQLVAPL
jgi:ABC-type sulfate/molybdate transport systems ATPase subunit